MLTQIYEVSTPGEARSISMIGVDHIGILVGTGEFPRELSVDTAAEVAAEVLPPSRVSTLFLTSDLSAIEKCAYKLRPSIVHLGAAPELLSPEDVAALKSALPNALFVRACRLWMKQALPLLASTMRSSISCFWTAIGHPIGRLARLACHMTGRSAGVSSSLSEPP